MLKDCRRWTVLTLILIILPLLLAAGFVYYIDPLWTFNHTNRFNNIQMGFDERQQKTNRVTFGRFDYDTLIIGSSRVTYYKQTDFAGMKAYNYAVSNILLDEYDPYISYARSKNGRDFDNIIIGLDFSSTNNSLKFQEFQQPSFYIANSNAPFYRCKTLLSADALNYAWHDFNASRSGIRSNFTYDCNNIKNLNLVDNDEERMAKINATVVKYHNDIYANYQYTDVINKLEKIKADNPHSRFMVFITPVSSPLFNLIVKDNLYLYYERWLRDCVQVFGGVYDFMYPNSITTNLKNFYDGSHVYPSIGTLIAHRIIGYPDDRIPADFGILINQQNIEQHLQYIRQEVGIK